MAIEQPEAAGDALVVALKDGLRTLRLREPARDPKDAWREVLAKNPEVAWAAPSFRDASGNEMLPTGVVVVRFRKKPSATELAAFVKEESLELERRTPLVPEQASFRPRQPREVYLPELVARLARRPDVAAAWPATSARYRKA